MKFVLRLILVFELVTFGLFSAFSSERNPGSQESRLKEGKKDTSQVNLLNDLSFEYYSPDPIRSKRYADQALSISKEIGYSKGEGIAYRNIGNFYWTQGNYDKSFEYLFQSVGILEKAGDQKEIARSYNSIGLVYRDIKKFDAALDYMNKAFEIYVNTDDKMRVGILYNNIGGVHIRKGSFNEALNNLLKANKIFKEINNLSRIATNLNNIGYLYIQEGKPDKALEYLFNAYEIDSTIKDNGRMAQNLNGIAEAYKAKGDFKKAISYYQSALEITEEIGLKEETKNAYKGLASLYAESRNFEVAYKYYQMYHAIYDSLFNETSTKKIRQLEALYESERKQAEIDILTKNKLLNQTELQKEKIIRNSLIGAFVAVAIIAFILFLGIGQKQKINKQLEEQKTEIQIKNDDLLQKNREITFQKDEIAAQRDAIKNKTSELESALQEINSQKEALVQLNATKNKFFSIVAHDIKSPLDSLSAFASLLANYLENMTKEEIRTIATNLDQSVKNTLQLTENLLTWARSQMDSLNYNPTSVNIQEVIEQKIGLFKLIAQNKNINIVVELESDITLFVDENHLRFVLRNLISNALKFTMPGGTICIKAEGRGELAEISVADDGVGISPEVLPKIFRIDTKVSTRGTAGEKGTGLGLLLCKEFVEKNGGKIHVSSEVAKGSKFSIMLKRAEVLV